MNEQSTPTEISESVKRELKKLSLTTTISYDSAVEYYVMIDSRLRAATSSHITTDAIIKTMRVCIEVSDGSELSIFGTIHLALRCAENQFGTHTLNDLYISRYKTRGDMDEITKIQTELNGLSDDIKHIETIITNLKTSNHNLVGACDNAKSAFREILKAIGKDGDYTIEESRDIIIDAVNGNK